MRRNPTAAEKLLWSQLRKSQTGYKFRRQQRLFGFVADFFCAKLGLVVEADGPVHNSERDAHRDNELAKYGITTLRLGNDQIMCNLDACVFAIIGACRRIAARTVPPGIDRHQTPVPLGP